VIVYVVICQRKRVSVLTTQAFAYKHNVEARLGNDCYGGKTVHTSSECVSVSSMQCTCAVLFVLSPVACPALQYFFTLSHKRHDFGGKI